MAANYKDLGPALSALTKEFLNANDRIIAIYNFFDGKDPSDAALDELLNSKVQFLKSRFILNSDLSDIYFHEYVEYLIGVHERISQ